MRPWPVAQWFELPSMHQEVAGWIHSGAHARVAGSILVGDVQQAAHPICFSLIGVILSDPLPSSLSKNTLKINKSI